MKYTAEFEFLDAVESHEDETNKRDILSNSEIENLRSEFEGISDELIDYLMEIGSGSFRECQFNIHNRLFTLEDLGLEDVYQIKDEIKFFGDNFAGDFAGFDFSGDPNLVVEFWHEDGTIFDTKKTFKVYIREQMLLGANGEDLRQ
ncbi:MAG: hypothetical protein R8G66_22965 [Cytophagales bacterium]|nr:hypothetical protein [Cytophagales bacterium]